MAAIGRPKANRFAPLDSELGSRHTAEGMTQNVYADVCESGNRPQTTEIKKANTRNSMVPSGQSSRVNYRLQLQLLLQVAARQRAAHKNVRTSLDIPEEIARKPPFSYASLPAELRQMILRELVPTRSIWNGTSFPKSSPRRYQRDYFKTTKYLQNRALAH
ncbi:hypothetical protein DHEL01_v205164 [Diaporthe helianthi]|uniref:Uncharacterized protein n=1 Tax=Diaporthe helianthi TaxID=158607 RepID=A0A2P5I1R4_DIAHE|nr:hypothetical protein DHEL01_v205164 [Diaporthe helianthi]